MKFENGKLITEWDNLLISKDGINFKIMANINDVDLIQVYLLEDSISYQADNYTLPNFPLEPNILTR